MSILKINDISYQYGKGFTALSQISFSIEKKDFYVILGPNGSGKTTLLRIISGVLHPCSGEVLLQEKPIQKMSRRQTARKISFVPQNITVDFPFSVKEVVLMGRFSHTKGLGIENKKDIDIAQYAMEMTGTWDLSNRMIHQLSGGERQRVFIAQAIAAEAEIMILDEPISSLDIKYKIEILELLANLNRRQNITIITTLHDLNLAGAFADKILLLKKGSVAAQGPPKEVLVPSIIEPVYNTRFNTIEDGTGGRLIIPITSQGNNYKAGETIESIKG